MLFDLLSCPIARAHRRTRLTLHKNMSDRTGQGSSPHLSRPSQQRSLHPLGLLLFELRRPSARELTRRAARARRGTRRTQAGSRTTDHLRSSAPHFRGKARSDQGRTLKYRTLLRCGARVRGQISKNIFGEEYSSGKIMKRAVQSFCDRNRETSVETQSCTRPSPSDTLYMWQTGNLRVNCPPLLLRPFLPPAPSRSLDSQKHIGLTQYMRFTYGPSELHLA